MLNFKNIEISDKEIIEKIANKYGEKSSQHGFSSMFCLKDKYNDKYCIIDEYLYVLRSNLEDENYRIYLFPLGDYNNTLGIIKAVNNILDDAKSHGKKVSFVTVTENAKNILETNFESKFGIIEDRDSFEYIYDLNKFARLPGGSLARIRNHVNKFYRQFENRFLVKKIVPSMKDELIEVYDKWASTHDKIEKGLLDEYNGIKRGLEYFDDLNLIGVSLYIDNKMEGFVYGARVSDNTFDLMIEKANTEIENSFKVLNKELGEYLLNDFTYLNYEEDVGKLGLREVKTRYQPDILLKKYIIKEI